MAAPVVPTNEASTMPMIMRAAFTSGVPRSEPRDVDATAYREERRDEDQERHVVDDGHVEQLVEAFGAEAEHERHGEEERPRGRDLAEVVMPEAGREKRAERDRQEDADERDGAPDGEQGSEIRRGAVHDGATP